MTQQLIAIDADALKDMQAQLQELKSIVLAARFQPEPKWLPVREYANHVGKSESTVNRWIANGEVEAKTVGKTRMVRV
jgi:hypothetical protein